MVQTLSAVTSLFGRESETHVLDDFLDHVYDYGGSLVVSGGPGVGKSALLSQASTRGKDRGMLDDRAPDLPAAVRERVLEEAAGNPLALVELPATLTHLGGAARLPVWLPLTTRLEQAFAARAFDLPASTRRALLVAAVNDSSLLSEVLGAIAVLAGEELTIEVLAPPQARGYQRLTTPISGSATR